MPTYADDWNSRQLAQRSLDVSGPVYIEVSRAEGGGEVWDEQDGMDVDAVELDDEKLTDVVEQVWKAREGGWALGAEVKIGREFGVTLLDDSSSFLGDATSHPATYLVLDTNVLISNLALTTALYQFLRSFPIERRPVTLVIPYMVLSELDNLKDVHSVGPKARMASAWLVDAMQSERDPAGIGEQGDWKGRALVVQGRQEHAAIAGASSGGNNDDVIVSVCVHLRQRSGSGGVVFFSHDNNATLKASADGVPVLTLRDLRACEVVEKYGHRQVALDKVVIRVRALAVKASPAPTPGVDTADVAPIAHPACSSPTAQASSATYPGAGGSSALPPRTESIDWLGSRPQLTSVSSMSSAFSAASPESPSPTLSKPSSVASGSLPARRHSASHKCKPSRSVSYQPPPLSPHALHAEIRDYINTFVPQAIYNFLIPPSMIPDDQQWQNMTALECFVYMLRHWDSPVGDGGRAMKEAFAETDEPQLSTWSSGLRANSSRSTSLSARVATSGASIWAPPSSSSPSSSTSSPSRSVFKGRDQAGLVRRKRSEGELANVYDDVFLLVSFFGHPPPPPSEAPATSPRSPSSPISQQPFIMTQADQKAWRSVLNALQQVLLSGSLLDADGGWRKIEAEEAVRQWKSEMRRMVNSAVTIGGGVDLSPADSTAIVPASTTSVDDGNLGNGMDLDPDVP